MALRVLIDAHMLGSQETGNETYVANLLGHLSQLPGVRCGAALTPSRSPPSLSRDIECMPLARRGNWARLLWALPLACRRWEADILHVTYNGPFLSPCPMVVTVHDVSFKHHPEFFSARDRLLFATLLPITLRRAAAVITVSNHAQQAILRAYPYVSGRVHVAWNAPSPIFRPIAQPELLLSIRRRYGIRNGFVLAVGNIQPRKNLVRLIQAFAAIRQQWESLQMVIVGQAQWRSSAAYHEVKHLGLEQDVIFPGYVTEEELVLLYNAAQVFVYPSIYEGFGLPILEAMACGTPVVASNTTSMPEVAGEAALLVSPHNPEDIAGAMNMLLHDPRLRRTLRARGLEQANRFSWTKTARQTLAVYRAVTACHSLPEDRGI